MEIVVKGRNVEVPDHYRIHVAEKLAKIERYDHKLMRVDVELFHERNPRLADQCQRVEITCISRGPVVRAEASARDFYSALDAAVTKLDGRLRRAADRRRIHRGRHTPLSVAEATAPLAKADQLSVGAAQPLAGPGQPTAATLTVDAPPVTEDRLDGEPDPLDEGPGRVVRRKEHPGEPMTVDQALFHMELVGHDFYLFNDKDSGRPSVVYRRKGYDYGLISLTS